MAIVFNLMSIIDCSPLYQTVFPPVFVLRFLTFFHFGRCLRVNRRTKMYVIELHMIFGLISGKVSEVVVKAISVISKDNVEMKHSPCLVRPKDQSSSALLGALDLPGCFIDDLCARPGNFRFVQIVGGVC